MTATIDNDDTRSLSQDEVAQRVREICAESERVGRPGRPTLLELIPGATEHQVRRALAELDASRTSAGEAGGLTLFDAASDPDGQDPAPVHSQPDSTRPAPPAWTGAPAPVLPEAAPARWVNAGEPRRLPLVLIGLAAAVAVWGGWVELGKLTGFGVVQPLPGLLDELKINTAIVLPLGIEAYGGYALRTWLSSARLTARTRAFARWSAIASLVIGAGAQVASHLMRSAGMTVAPPVVTVLVSCVPVLVLGLATGLATLVRRDASPAPAATREAA